jgi:hypothetical protein
MKRKPFPLLALLITTILAALPAAAERGDDANRLSKNGKTTGVIDEVDVTIEYGRPSVKDRKIWGGLVPYDKVWRTGADEATTISFSSDVHLGGEALPAGVYSLFTIPGEEQWTIIFNRVAEQWGAFNYDESQDALRMTAQPQTADHVETLEFQIEGSDVVVRWEKLAVPLTVEAAE